MANSYIQSYHQFVFSTKKREPFIPPQHRGLVEKYIGGIVTNLNQKMIAAYCMPDHIHLLIGMNGTISLSELMEKVKANSSKFLNTLDWMKTKFRWQEGYGAFSYSHSHLGAVIRYIENQEERHQKMTFKEEYLNFLDKFGVEYDIRYVFD